jgi:hypothetical protein
MRILIASAITALLVGVGVAVAQSPSTGSMTPLNSAMSQQAARDCVFPAGGWTIVNPDTSSAASSGNLTTYTRYIVQCREDSYISFSGTTADANDGYLPKGAMLPFITTASERAFSVLNVSVDSDCRYIECR